jgi:hypothetical protein
VSRSPRIRASLCGLVLVALLAGCGADKDGAPEQVISDATFTSQQMSRSDPEWAAFVPVSVAQAKLVLGAGADGLDRIAGDADEMYLVVMKGEFRSSPFSTERDGGRYVTFVSSRAGETRTASNFVLSDRPPDTGPLPRRLRRFDLPALADPALARAWSTTVGAAVLYLVPLLLAAAAVLMAARPERRWPRFLGLGAALVALAVQIALFARSLSGVNDGSFIAIKSGFLAVALLIELTAAVAAPLSGRRRWRIAALTALVAAAVFYTATISFIGTTGE